MGQDITPTTSEPRLAIGTGQLTGTSPEKPQHIVKGVNSRTGKVHWAARESKPTGIQHDADGKKIPYAHLLQVCGASSRQHVSLDEITDGTVAVDCKRCAAQYGHGLATYLKAMSNTSVVHLAFRATGQAACATGKVQPRVVLLSADEQQSAEVTCKRCLKIEARQVLDEVQEFLDADKAQAAAAPTARELAMQAVPELVLLDEGPEGAPQQPTGDATPAPRARLAKGVAEARALAFLAQNMGSSYGPHEIAKAIDARGVRDLLARLAEQGKVQCTSDQPKRYAAIAAK